MAKRPSFQFYPGDWLKDPELGMCSPQTRGIWMDLLCAMHEAGCGKITGTVRQLARICRCESPEMEAALSEISSTKSGDVTKCDGVVTVVSRRLTREHKERESARIRQKRSRGGKTGKECHADVTENSRSHSSSSTSSSSSNNSEELFLSPSSPCPKAGSKTTEAEGQLMARVGALFNRRASTRWSPKETASFRRALPISEDDLADLERYYATDIPKDRDYRRRNIETLLNNFAAEVDKARRFFRDVDRQTESRKAEYATF